MSNTAVYLHELNFKILQKIMLLCALHSNTPVNTKKNILDWTVEYGDIQRAHNFKFT